MSIETITEAKIREIFKDEFERHYRETHHTFSIEGGINKKIGNIFK